MPDTITEIKHNIGKPDQTFTCRLLHHGGNRIVLSYRAEKSYHAAGIGIPAHTLTLAYYQEELPYIFWKMIGPDDQLIGYYVHLCEAVRITADTVEYRDMMLDVWFFPDGAHRLLDGHELAAACASGLVDDAAVARVHRQANDLIERFAALRSWFDSLLADIQKSA